MWHREADFYSLSHFFLPPLISGCQTSPAALPPNLFTVARAARPPASSPSPCSSTFPNPNPLHNTLLFFFFFFTMVTSKYDLILFSLCQAVPRYSCASVSPYLRQWQGCLLLYITSDTGLCPSCLDIFSEVDKFVDLF